MGSRKPGKPLKTSTIFPPKAQCDYTAFFCEENIWWLGRRLVDAGWPLGAGTVWLISNQRREVPLLKQRRDEHGVVLWDYHVVLQWRDEADHWILDFDSALPWPCPLEHYLMASFPARETLHQEWWIKIRRVPLSDYLSRLHSDRGHMRDAQGNPVCPFPPTPPIVAEPGVPLWHYLDMTEESPGALNWWFELKNNV